MRWYRAHLAYLRWQSAVHPSVRWQSGYLSFLGVTGNVPVKPVDADETQKICENLPERPMQKKNLGTARDTQILKAYFELVSKCNCESQIFTGDEQCLHYLFQYLLRRSRVQGVTTGRAFLPCKLALECEITHYGHKTVLSVGAQRKLFSDS